MDNYNFLKKNLILVIADCFDYPEERYFKIDEKNILLNNLGFLKKLYPNKKISLFFDKLFNFLENINTEEIERIKKEHFEYFTSPKAKTPPYASYYIDGKLFGNSYFNMKELLLKEGYVRNPHFGNTEDYISNELEYIYHIYDKKEKLKKFLKEHFSIWFMKFYDEIKDKKISGFYKICIELIKILIEEEQNDF